MTTPLNAARLRTTRNTAFCWELTTCAVRTSSAVRPNLVRAPGRRDLRHRLAAPVPCPCIGLHARTRFDGNRFAREHGLVEQDLPARNVHIRGDHRAERKFHQVARHQLGGGHGLPRAVAPDRGVERESRFQRRKGRLGAALLEQTRALH